MHCSGVHSVCLVEKILGQAIVKENVSMSFHLQKMFSPPMPGDVMVNFYINLSKLCLTVYQLHVLPPNTTKVRTCDSS